MSFERLIIQQTQFCLKKSALPTICMFAHTLTSNMTVQGVNEMYRSSVFH